MLRFRHRPGVVFLLLFVWSMAARAIAQQSPQAATAIAEERLYPHAVVAADHPLASRAGIEILQKGGNVVDAAVATGFALSVLRPASSGIGGGGFMVIWNSESGEATALDYREQAPRKASRDMFLKAAEKSAGNPAAVSSRAAELSRHGHLAVAIPGHVAGLCYANSHFGRLDLKTVMGPAIRLAREGISADQYSHSDAPTADDPYWKNADNRKRFAPLFQQYFNDGKAWGKGERFRSPQLKALELIAEHGADGFYKGTVADAIIAEMQRGGGLITHEDLQAVRPVVRRPIRGEYNGLQLLTMPPPSSGGIALIEALNILTMYERSHAGETLDRLGHNRPAYLHLLTEAMKHAFADRAEFLGDTDFAAVPVERLTSRDYAAVLARRIEAAKTHPPEHYGRYLPVNDGGTTHFSVIDAAGNAVACTETINTGFGSYVVVPEYGIVLNNEMEDFTAVPGQPNVFGLLQSEANAVEPLKRPLSSMTPTIVVRDGKAVFALGASGGPRIISTTLQVLLNLSRFDMPPRAAVDAPRIHHQWLPHTLYAEDPLFDAVERPLQRLGHETERRNRLAACQAVKRTDAGLLGASDPRKQGEHSGY